MCVLFHFYVLCLHVCAYAFRFKVYCGSALGPGASWLPQQKCPEFRKHRTSSCGGSIVQAGESCDDGNQIAQDRCSSSCMLETGYMCYNSQREFDTGIVGTEVMWGAGSRINAEDHVLRVLETAETCKKDEICHYAHKWQPEFWKGVYGNHTDRKYLKNGQRAKARALDSLRRWCQEMFGSPEHRTLECSES